VFGQKKSRRGHPRTSSAERANRFFALLGILVILGAGGYFCFDQMQSQSATLTAKALENPTSASHTVGIIDKLTRLRIDAASNPENPKIWLKLAMYLRQEGKYDNANSAYRMALRLMPEDFYINVSYRLFLVEIGESNVLEQQIQKFENSGELPPPDWKIIQAVLLMRAGNQLKAKRLWSESIESLPKTMVDALSKDTVLTGLQL
jgi:tetratricopeptide (TPR) repeat protein